MLLVSGSLYEKAEVGLSIINKHATFVKTTEAWFFFFMHFDQRHFQISVFVHYY